MNLFANVSRYKVNEEKSIIFGLNILAGDKQQISQRCKVRWKHENVRYLGIRLSAEPNAQELIASNVTPMINEINSKILLFGKIISSVVWLSCDS